MNLHKGIPLLEEFPTGVELKTFSSPRQPRKEKQMISCVLFCFFFAPTFALQQRKFLTQHVTTKRFLT